MADRNAGALSGSNWQHDMYNLRATFIDLKRQNELFKRFNQVGQANPELVKAWQDNNPFPHGITMWFGYYSSVVVRRLRDRSKDSRSIVNLLQEMADSPLLEKVLGTGTVLPDELLRDRDSILKITERERHFVDRAVAHSDKRGVVKGNHPTFNELDKTINSLEPYFEKYGKLFGLNSPLDPGLPKDWDSIFKFPWIESAAVSSQ